MASDGSSKTLTTATLTIALAAVSASVAVSLYAWRRKWEAKVSELEKSLDHAVEKTAAERKGRVRAQQILRRTLSQTKTDKADNTCYPMRPIGIVHSCFSTRNGTPRQPLLVPLARAHLNFDSSIIPTASLGGLEEFSHCWILYVFHLNTNMEKLWEQPSKPRFKAKVRVPKLKGGRIGLFGTRSPHRPCPIGLTVAKVEAIEGHTLVLSGVDLVDGTPVLDVKPYLPYCDSVKGATAPSWVTDDNLLSVASVNFSEGFSSSLADTWEKLEKKCLYSSPDDFQNLIKQVLSYDIRSLSQRNRPHAHVRVGTIPENTLDSISDLDEEPEEESPEPRHNTTTLAPGKVMYHLLLGGMDIAYKIDSNSDVTVEDVIISSDDNNPFQKPDDYQTCGDELR